MATHAERDRVAEFFEANASFHARLVDASGNAKLEELYRQLLDQLGRYRTRSLLLRGNLQRSVAEHAAILRAAKRGDADRASHLMSEHIRVPQRRLKALSDEELSRPRAEPRDRVRRQPQQPRAADRARLRRADAARPVGDRRGAAGFDSVWVGDSLFSKPRYEPISLLSAISQRTSRVRLGHRLHGLLDAESALPRARVGDARRDLGRPDDPRHRDGQSRGRSAARVRGARARLRQARRAVRGRARRHPPALDRGQDGLPRQVPRLRRASRSTPAPRWRR